MRSFHQNYIQILLEEFSTIYNLEQLLLRKYKSKNQDIIDSTNQLQVDLAETLFWYFEQESVDEAIKLRKGKNFSPLDIISLPSNSTNFHKIALEASSYFQQGLEMFKTTFQMNLNSSPLLEYYSFLQCVKGRIMIDLIINPEICFSFHGLSYKKEDTKYFCAKVKPLGV